MKIEDIPTLASFPRNFPWPNIVSPTFVVKKVAIGEDNSIVGAAFVKITAEVILLLEDDRSNIEKTKTIIQLASELRPEAKKLGLEDCHVWVKDEKFRDILTHLGFKNCEFPSMVMFL